MRVRLQLLAPFEESKALVLLPSDVQTIHELKRHLRQSLSTVLALTSSPKDLLLEIDGFELLPGSSTDIIEPSDVVTVRLRAGSSKQELGIRKRSSSREVGQSKKRRLEDRGSTRPASEATSVLAQARVRTPSPAASNTTSSSSSSSSSETASSSSTDSSSSSSSASTSSSSSSSADSFNNGPLAKSNPPFPIPPASLKLPSGSATNHVKPGGGKMSTKERNERRRIARRMQKQAEERGGPMAERTRGPDRTVGNSATTLNGQAGGNSVTNTQLESPVPTLANQNKKKGSLKELQNIQGTKTIFGIDAQASSTPLKDLKSSTAKSTPNPTPSRSSTWAQSRVIPPSELEVLPSNVFVTHVEYQRNGWTPRQRNQRGVQKALIDTSTVVDVDAGVDETEDMDEEAFLNDSMAVNEAETNHVQLLEDAQTSDDVNEDIWTVAESRFDTLPPLKAGSMPCEGTVLAWKELLLDPYTFSPQLAIQLGTLKSVKLETVLVQRLQQEAEEEDQLNVLDPEVVVNLSDLNEDVGKYRIVKRSA